MATATAVRHGGMHRVAQHMVILWFLWAVAGPGSCDHSSYVQGPSWGLPRSPQLLKKAGRSDDDEARQLTNDMKNAESAEALVDLVLTAVDWPIFNKFHASCAYHRLATWKRRGKLPKSVNTHGFPQLNGQVEEMIEEGQLGGRQLANVLWSIAHLCDQFPSVLDVVPAIAKQVPLKAKDMIPQALSNVLWASAKLKDDAPAVLDLVPAVGAQVLLKAKDMDQQALSNILWASASLKSDAPAVLDLVPAIVAEVPLKAKDMKPQELSNVLWASASLKSDAPAVLDLVPAIAAQVPVKAKDMIPQHLSNVLWASASLKSDGPAVLDLVTAIVAQVPLKAKDMKPQELSNSFVALIDLQDAVPGVKSFLTDEGGSEVPFAPLAASRVAKLVPKLSGLDLLVSVPYVIWGCWKLGVRHDELLSAAARRLGSKKKISSLSAWGLCALLGIYELVDSTDQYHDFKEMLQEELTKTRLSQSDVGWSMEGPLEWARVRK